MCEYEVVKIGLRADASDKIGAGHGMRLYALAEELLGRGVDVAFVGSIEKLTWFESKLRGLRGLEVVSVAEATFNSDVFRELGINSVVIDSYAFAQSDFVAWRDEGLNPLVIVDGPWQKISGGSFVAPILNTAVEWIEDLRRESNNVYAGPSYALLRTEVTSLRNQPSAMGVKTRTVVLSFGGSEICLVSESFIERLGALAPDHEVLIYGPAPPASSRTKNFKPINVEYRAQGPGFLQAARRAEVVVTGAGSTVFELIFMGIRAIYVPIYENQAENARAIELFDLGKTIHLGHSCFEELLLSAISEHLETKRQFSSLPPISAELDGRGAARVADIAIRNGSKLDL